MKSLTNIRDFKATQIRYNAIFHSVFKALLVFEMLLEGPITLDEIQRKLSEYKNFKSDISKDSIRVYINSFKSVGCTVKRQLTKEKRRQYVHFIPDNPFRPSISATQIDQFFNIYDIIMYNETFENFLQFHQLTKTLDECFKNDDFHEKFLKHSLIENLDFQLLKDLNKCCQNKELVTVLYSSPRSKEKEIPIIAHNMVFQNYKLYLAGFGKEYNQDAIFLTDRIIKITNREPVDDKESNPNNKFEIVFELYNPSTELLENEEIISQTETTRTVLHKTTNKILSTQRFMQLASTCKIISPQEYKEFFISHLKSTAKVYTNGK